MSRDEDSGSWVLFYIEADPEADRVRRLGEYDSMLDCFDAWSEAEDRLPESKVNFQIICVRTGPTLPS